MTAVAASKTRYLVHIGRSPTLCGVETSPRTWPTAPVFHGQIRAEAGRYHSDRMALPCVLPDPQGTAGVTWT